MRVCYAVCDSSVQIDHDLRTRIKSELLRAIQKDEITAFLNGFEGDNAEQFESIVSETCFSGDVDRVKWHSWTVGHYDLLIAIEHGKTDHIGKIIREAWSSSKKYSVIWV